MSLNLQYVYGYITKLCRQQAEVIQTHENEHDRNNGQGQTNVENVRGLNLAAVKLTSVQVPKLPLYHKISDIFMICFAKSGLTEDLYIEQKEGFSVTCCNVML
jgi:hypothetical protein